MSNMTNRRVTLKTRPMGIPQAGNFELNAEQVPELADGEMLVSNSYLSVDPAMRGWLSDTKGYGTRIEVGDVMRAFAVGKVIRSRNSAFVPGDCVMGLFGWQELAVVRAEQVLLRINDQNFPLSLYLGVLGVNGIAAYFGLREIGAPLAGETVLVSTAAGAVGSCVGQIAKTLGCTVIGIAGGPEKCQQCIDEFGFDAAIDYKSEPDLETALSRLCPNGVDVYFDNTSGAISDAVLPNLAIGARVVVCGTASIESWNPWPAGPRCERHLLVKRAMMRGFIALDYADRYDEAVSQLGQWVSEGKLRYREEILDGLEQAPAAIARLYSGKNQGKLLIRLPAAKG
jgi:NADPH-dependent curcumin reductase